MPTLVRFLVVVLVLAGLAGAAVFYLANFIHPNTREMTIRIPASRLEPVPVVPAAAPPAASAPEPAPADGAPAPAEAASSPGAG